MSRRARWDAVTATSRWTTTGGRRLSAIAVLTTAALLAASGASAGTGPGTSAEVAADVASSVTIETLPSNLSPSVQTAGNDTAYVDTPSLAACNTTGVTIPFAKCVFGDPSGTHTMVLWGDSHAFMWFPAVNAVARALHWRLVAMMKFGCPDADVAVWNPLTKVPYTTCNKFRSNMIAHINKVRPQLVILTEAFTGLGAAGKGANTITTSQWQSALKKTLSLLHGRGMKKVVLGSTVAGPVLPSPPECLAANPSSVQKCTVDDTAAQRSQRAAEAGAAKAAATTYVNVLPWLCSSASTPTACVGVIGDSSSGYKVVYYAAGHLTETYALFVSGVLQAALKPHMG